MKLDLQSLTPKNGDYMRVQHILSRSKSLQSIYFSLIKYFTHHSSEKSTKGSNAKISDLNADCLYIIMRQLDLQSQVNMYKSVKCTEAVLEYIWATQLKKLYLNFADYNVPDDSFIVLLKQVHNTLQVLEIKNLGSYQYNTIRKFIFPQVQEFRFVQQQPYYMKEETILQLNHMFPNVTSFKPDGAFSGKYMSRMCKLKYISLRRCKNIKFQFLQELLANLKLTCLKLDTFINDLTFLEGRALINFCNLEELTINPWELKLFEYLNEKQFKAIKSITLTRIKHTKTYHVHCSDKELCEIEYFSYPSRTKSNEFLKLVVLRESENVKIVRYEQYHHQRIYLELELMEGGLIRRMVVNCRINFIKARCDKRVASLCFRGENISLIFHTERSTVIRSKEPFKCCY